MIDSDEMEELKAEFAPRRRRFIRCHDQMCGAEDCPNCHPENFRAGQYVEDGEQSFQ